MSVALADPYYRYRVQVGPYVWEGERGDPAAYGPTDDLRIGWKYPDNTAWPTQPEIPWAKFGVVVADAADFDGVDIGTEVSLAVWHRPVSDPIPAGYLDGTGEGLWVPIASFGGRVVELNAEPSRLGMIYRLECLDYLVDAAEARVSSTDDGGRAAEDLENRLTRIADLAEDVFVSPPWGFWSDPGWGVFHANPEPELKGALDHMVDHLAQFVSLPTLNGGARGVLVTNNVLGVYYPETNMTPDPAQRYKIQWRTRRLVTINNRAGYLPGLFRPTGAGGKWRVDLDPEATDAFADAFGNPTGADLPAEGFGILPADVVDFDADWSRTKKARAERVYVETTIDYVDVAGKRVQRTVQGQGYPTFTTTPPPTLTVQTELGYAQEARTLADWLLGEPLSAAGRWEVEKFTLHADRVPDRVARANAHLWFHPATALTVPLVAVSGIPPEQNPNGIGADFYAGILTSAEFVVRAGRYVIDFTLSREVPRAAAGTSLATGGALSPASIAADVTQAAVTYADLDPAYTHYDYRVCRKG